MLWSQQLDHLRLNQWSPASAVLRESWCSPRFHRCTNYLFCLLIIISFHQPPNLLTVLPMMSLSIAIFPTQVLVKPLPTRTTIILLLLVHQLFRISGESPLGALPCLFQFPQDYSPFCLAQTCSLFYPVTFKLDFSFH